MTDFIEKRKQAEADQQATNLKAYRQLARKAATGGKLSSQEETKLNALADTLELTTAMLEADAKVFRAEAELAPIAATADSARAEEKQMMNLRAEFEIEAGAKVDALNARRASIAAGQLSAGRRLKLALDAGDKLRQLRAKHFALLDVEDPNIAARRRHLAQGVFSDVAIGQYDTILIEQIMADPSQWRDLLAPGLTFIPLPGQSREQLDGLVAIATALIQDGRPAKYLLPNDAEPRIRRHRNAVLLVGESNDVSLYLFESEQWIVHWILAPGQSPQDLEALTGKFLLQLAERARPGITLPQLQAAQKRGRALIRKSEPAALATAEAS
ncbi:MAG TPA: hypothetical protein VK797_07320 [Tepidisphaeraceae bacterium]|jgi:hypothetical protein|nr:hypothetical protein [Tepidisphaeraceae bacterium]